MGGLSAKSNQFNFVKEYNEVQNMSGEPDRVLTFQQKARALEALGHLSIQLDVNDEWFVHQPTVDIGNGSLLRSVASRGDSPMAAVESCWLEVTNLKREEYIRVSRSDVNHLVSKYRWNGFMWSEVR